MVAIHSFLAFAVMFTAFPSYAVSPLGKEVAALDFFKSIAGKYEVQLIAGKVPKEPSYKIGSVDVEEVEQEISLGFSYCVPPKNCNTGAFFALNAPDESVKVYHQTLKSGAQLYSIVQKKPSETKNFEWEIQTSKTIFRRFKFVYENEPPFDLVYEIVKTK